MGLGIAWIKLNGPLVQAASLSLTFGLNHRKGPAAQHTFISCKIRRQLALCALGTCCLKPPHQRSNDGADDFVLNREDVLLTAVKSFRPEMVT